ncbi:MAG: peptide MFS transporter [Candidatus Eisenbacteria bacterium]|nr:peptide MFS transporter [Candidatus Eisenbacteria bacterium]
MTASSIPTESRTAVTPAAPPGAARHPRGLFVLFAAEMWERFGFYTMLALFTLYLQDGQQGFGWTKAQATNLYANYLMFVYFSPLVGGWLADRKLGYRRAVMLGGLIFMAGYLLLTIRSLPMVYLALTCLVVGNGFFKPNVSAMVGNLYQEGSHLKDRAYNIFYMGINIGAFIAPLVAEAVKQHFGTHLAFGVAALGMVISVSVLWRFKRLIEGTEKNARLGAESGQAAAAISRPIDAIPHRKRIGALIVIYLVVIVFWMVFHQNGSTLTYWANDNTDWASSKVLAAIIWLLSFGSISIEKVSGTLASAINPFFVVTLTFPLVWFWQRLDRRGREPATTTKIMIGMFLTAISFYLLCLGAKAGGDVGRVSPWWLIGAYAIITTGELMLSPMGLALVSKVAPPHMRGIMMGGWFAATAIGNKLTMIGVYWDIWPHSKFFFVLGTAALVMGFVLFALLKPLKKWMPGT